MIWVHCGDTSEVTTTCSLVTRLAEQCDASDILLTAPFDVAGAFDSVPVGTKVVMTPPDTPTKTRAFLDEHTPRSLIWNGGPLRPALLRGVEQEEIPAIFINARNDGLVSRGSRWIPRAARAAVTAFQHILTADGATVTRLIRGGVPRDRVEAAGPILEEPIALPHDQYELTVMAEALGTRPIWFAADVAEKEVALVAKAHLSASRKNHRLLLLITPRDITAGSAVADELRRAGLSVGVRSEGEDPEPEHQAYVADLPDELGLWYRLAPLTFVGGTLSGGGAASPFEPILLGSAILHGTIKSPQEMRFERLAKAQACREVRSASELGVAVGALVSPELTARMALAGWEEITRNADTINRLVAMALGQEVATP